MRTVTQLRQAGFIVQPAQDAVDCTELLSAAPCWYYNPRFAETMSEVNEALQPVPSVGSGYRLVAAGKFADEDVFPFNILDAQRKVYLDDARSRYLVALKDATRAEEDYHDVLRTDEAYIE